MAQQSARRGRKNQMYSSCLQHAFMIWFRSANSHTGPQLHRCIRGRTDGSIRLCANLLQKSKDEYSLSAKWLELLKQIAPNVTRVAVIRNSDHPAGMALFGAIQNAAQSLG